MSGELELRFILLAVIWIGGWLALWKIPLLEPASLSSLRDPVAQKISVIIPARDEEINLSVLLGSLVRQRRPPDEIVVVDDHSRDRTPEIATSFGAKLVTLSEVPLGWLGKGWACWTGARAAVGDLLVFLDADTHLAPDALFRLVQEHGKRGGLLSVQPYHLMKKPFERLSAFFNIILFLNMNISSFFSRLNRPLGAFGPCLVCRRQDYFAVGGHERVSKEILEDMALGKIFKNRGFHLGCLSGRGSVFFRMYPQGISQLSEGWTKNFASGAFSSSWPLVLFSFAWITACLSGPVDIVRGLVLRNGLFLLSGGIFYLIFAIQIHWILRRLGNFGWVVALFYPGPLVFFILIFARSLFFTCILGRVTWKNRTISVGKKWKIR